MKIPVRYQPYFTAKDSRTWICNRCGRQLTANPLSAQAHLTAHVREVLRTKKGKPS